MPSDFYDTTRPETVKLWAKTTWWDWRVSDSMYDPRNGMIGDDPEKFPIVEINDFEGGPGDEVTISLGHLIGGRGKVGAEQLSGTGTVTDTSTFKAKVDILRHAVKVNGVLINEQRVPFKLMKDASRLLRTWFQERRAVMTINHMAGNSRQTDLAYCGSNTVAEPDTGHIYRVNQGLGASNDQTVGGDTTAKFDLPIIDELLWAAESQTPPLKPFIWKGNPYYGLLLHPNVIRHMKANGTQFDTLAKYALQGGIVDGNPFFSRALFKYRNVLIFSEPYIPQGKNSSTSVAVANTRRNVFFGAGAVLTGFGVLPGDGDRLMWTNEVTDHKMKFEVGATQAPAVKAIRFADQTNTARDLGRIVVVSYAADAPNPYIIAAGAVGSFLTTYDLGQPQ